MVPVGFVIKDGPVEIPEDMKNMSREEAEDEIKNLLIKAGKIKDGKINPKDDFGD